MAAPIDRGRLLAHAGGLAGLAADIARVFVERRHQIVAPLDAAIAARSADDLARAAHTARGALAMVGATGAVALCDRIEAGAADPDACAPLVAELTGEVERAATALLEGDGSAA
jgi:HPt (histidine-containing phosphotransfer) domain-containing protein